MKERPVIPTTKQNINTDKKLDLETDRLYVHRLGDKPGNTELLFLKKMHLERQLTIVAQLSTYEAVQPDTNTTELNIWR